MSLRNCSTNRAIQKLTSSNAYPNFLTKTPLAVAISLALMAGTVNAATLNGIKFNDANNNGLLDTGEMRYANQLVSLRNNTTGETKSARTNSSGRFEITGITAESDYNLSTSFPTGLCLTSTLRSVSFNSDSDVRTLDLGFGSCETPPPAPVDACDDNQATHIATSSGSWTSASTWASGTVPIEGSHVKIPDGIEVTVNQPVGLGSGGLCNWGTISSANGQFVNCAQPAGSGVDITINATRITNGGEIRAGNGANAPSNATFNAQGEFIRYDANGSYVDCGYQVNATAGKGGNVLIGGTEIFNEGAVIPGNGGNSSSAWAPSIAGAGGTIEIISDTNNSELSKTVGLSGGKGGRFAARPAWMQTERPSSDYKNGKGGDIILFVEEISPNISLSGEIVGPDLDPETGIARAWVGETEESTYFWEPVKLKAKAGTRILGYSNVEIYTDAGGSIDFTELKASAVIAKKIRIQTKALNGSGGTLDLRGVTGKVFKATQKVEIYADNILVNAGVDIRSLIDAPEITINSGQLAYFVRMTSSAITTGEPNTTVNIPVRIRNIGVNTDSYRFEVTTSKGWGLGTLSDVTLNRAEVKTVNLPVTLPAQRGLVDDIKIIAISQTNPSVRHELNVMANVNAGIDSDGDTYPDSLDAFPADVKEWRDSDKDSVGNNADIDDDNDGMLDEWEIKYLNALNSVANDAFEDFDKDGASNFEEFKANTDPTDANSKPVVVTPKVDLWVADPLPDDGTEPGKADWIYISPNVWVRNQNDGGISYQNPIYGQDNYVHVKVKNRGTLNTSKPAKVEVYRSGASMGRGWPAGWGLVGTATIDSLDAGKETTVVVKWDKDKMAVPGHYCFYVRVLSDEDSMFKTETNDLVWNTQQNNNVAWRNFDVVGFLQQVTNIFTVNVGNPNATPTTVNIVIKEEEGFLTNDGTIVIVDLGMDLFQRWQQTGAKGENVKVLEGTKVQLVAMPAKLIDLNLKADEQLPITMRIDATKPAPTAGVSKEYHLTAQEFEGDKLIGGVDYSIVARAQDTDSDGDAVKDVVDNDNDNDGIPDVWEIKYNLNPLNKEDANTDSDQDGLTNKQEFEAGLSPVSVDKTYKASGVITDDLGQAIVNVVITMNGKSAKTDEQGKWEITGLIEGNYEIAAEKEGYAFSQQKFSVGNDSNATVKFAGTPLLKAEVVAKPTIVDQGNEVVYLIKVRNTGAVKATNVVIANTLPVNFKFISFKAAEGIICDDATATCTIAEIAANSSVTVELTALAENSAKTTNTVTLSSESYPTDVVKTTVEVLPYLSITGGCTPNPVPMLTDTRCTLKVNVSSKSPEDAKEVVSEFNLAEGITFKSVIPAECDSSQLPKVLCNFGDMAVGTSKEMIIEGNLTDGGLLYFVQSASVSAGNYDAYGIKLRNEIYIPPEVQADIAIVIDITGSMQGEIDSVKKALEQFIKEISANLYPQVALIVFKDVVNVKAFTKDLTELLGTIKLLKAEGGGSCPEASVEALLKAIPHVKPNGTILFYTDASPYPDADIETLLAQLKAKNIRIHPVITGDCTSKDSWNSITNQ